MLSFSKFIMSFSEFLLFGAEGGGAESKLTDKYVRRRQRQNITMGGQPSTPFEAV